MQDAISKAIFYFYHVLPEKTSHLGGGFYGQVFLVVLPGDRSIVAKLYRFAGLAAKEAMQLNMLAAHSQLRVPRVFGVVEAGQSQGACDVLLMEYLEGINAGDQDVSAISEKDRGRICDQIVDNLLCLHNTVHPEGFGPLDGKIFYTSWEDYYYPKAQSIVKKAYALYEKGQLTKEILDIFDRSICSFDEIFSCPVKEASLIHGDYNAWNILLARDKSHAEAMIDPYGCCWGDREYDLYQLDNANGKAWGLLKRYAEKYPLSPNFAGKRAFYELYTEISHYYDSGVPVIPELVQRQAEALKQAISPYMERSFTIS